MENKSHVQVKLESSLQVCAYNKNIEAIVKICILNIFFYYFVINFQSTNLFSMNSLEEFNINLFIVHSKNINIIYFFILKNTFININFVSCRIQLEIHNKFFRRVHIFAIPFGFPFLFFGIMLNLNISGVYF